MALSGQAQGSWNWRALGGAGSVLRDEALGGIWKRRPWPSEGEGLRFLFLAFHLVLTTSDRN